VGGLLIDSFAAPMFATNCYVLAPGRNSECVVIDPGMPDVSAQLEEVLKRNNLKPVAIIATHGHLDHTFSIQPIADGYSIPAYIHSEDRAYLSAPEKLLSAEFSATVADMKFVEPAQVLELKNGEVINLVGLSFRAIHAPGHTRGSLMFEVDEEVLVSGDVLFAGSIGRTDLPTGSAKEMEETLRKKVVPLADHLQVLPGHGPETNMAHEKKNNPYLKSLVGRY
jgi:glyoxylase-like metal-dependent hydrolase (beta-lactamase superfamily II)